MAKSVLLGRIPRATTDELLLVKAQLPPGDWPYHELYLELSRRGVDPLGRLSDADLVLLIVSEQTTSRQKSFLMMEFAKYRLPKLPDAQIVQMIDACPSWSGLRSMLVQETQRRGMSQVTEKTSTTTNYGLLSPQRKGGWHIKE